MKDRLRRLVAIQLENQVKRLIKYHNLKVVAVTGSVGKTTTKLAIAQVLRQKYRVQVHPGNFNSEIGLPLAVFEANVPETLTNPLEWVKVFYANENKIRGKYPYDVLVLEMGADQPGDIAKFMKYIQPDVGVVTAIAPAHIEQFGSVEAVAQEKMLLAAGSRAVWLNAEDKRVMDESKKLNQPVQTFGVERGNVHFEGISRAKSLALKGRLQLQNGEVAVETAFVGRHSLSGLAAAGAVGEELGLDPSEIKAGLEEFKPVAGRMQLLDGAEGSIVIDDTYNSSPRATVAALETLIDLPGRKIAIMGSMNELGTMTESAHREVGEAAAKVDVLVTIGQNANRFLVAGAAAKGLSTDNIHQFDSPYAAGKFVKSILKKGDVVLAKGSQNGVFAEEAVAIILANSSDKNRLVRQSESWRRKKKMQFEDAL